MRQVLLFIVGGLMGGLGGVAVGIFIYPYIFLADIVATEQVTDAASKTVVATGTFIHADPSDPIHHGKGSITVYTDVVATGDDFEVGPGPKYHLYLVPDGDVTPDTPVDETMFVDLGRLRAFKGSQVFALPAGLEPTDYKSAVIWCEQFGVLISPASLTFH